MRWMTAWRTKTVWQICEQKHYYTVGIVCDENVQYHNADHKSQTIAVWRS